jgi:hypothetical protein
MRTLFETSFFGTRGFAGYAEARLGTVRLAQAAATTPADTSALTSGIEDLLKQLPPELLGTYSTKYQQCQNQLANGGAVGLVTGAKCLSDLYTEIKDLIKNGPPKPAPAPAPLASGIAPELAIGLGVVGILVLVWGLTKL